MGGGNYGGIKSGELFPLSLPLSLVFYPSLFQRSACCRHKGDAAPPPTPIHVFFSFLLFGKRKPRGLFGVAYVREMGNGEGASPS